MFTPAAQSLLSLDPDLGQLLSGDRLQAAGRELVARVTKLEPGPWQPERLCAAESASNLGLLVLTGTIARELWLHDMPSTELFGAGDLIRTWRADAAPEMVPTETCWNALSPASVALLDRDRAHALRRYPEVMAVVLDRLNARAERLAMSSAAASARMTGPLENAVSSTRTARSCWRGLRSVSTSTWTRMMRWSCFSRRASLSMTCSR